MRRAALAVVVAVLLATPNARAAPTTAERAEAQARFAQKRAATDYAAGNFGVAAARLELALKACKRCTTATRAVLLRDIGTMHLRAGRIGLAAAAWNDALKLSPDIALNPDYDTPEVRRAWDAARKPEPPPQQEQPQGQPKGDFPHTPAAEQKIGVALPVYVDPPAKANVARVVLKYRGEGATDWSSVDMRKMGEGWGALVPCDAMTKGNVRYWIQGLDANDAPVADSGDPKHPFTVPVRAEIAGDPPHLPGAPAPDGCASENDPSGPIGSQKRDIVEKIDLSGGSPAANEAQVAAQDDIQLRGFARVRASAALRGENVDADEPSNLRVPWEPGLAQPQLFAELRYSHGKTFEVTASGVVDYQLAPRTTYDVRTGDATRTTRGDLSLTLRELYVGTEQGPLSLRFGQQRIAWGTADAFPINDILNPRDLRDPVLVETELRYLPTLALRADFAVSNELEIEIALQPFFTPDVIDIYGRPWALVQPTAPAGLRGLLGALTALDPSLGRTLSPSLPQARLPFDSLSGAEGAAKIAYSGEEFDVALGYDYGLAHAPAITISPELAQQLATVDWTKASAGDLATALAAVHSGDLASSYPRRHHVGAWAAKVLSPFVLRAEAAYDSKATLLTQDLFAVTRSTLQGVASVEWQSGEAGKTFLVEQYYQRILGDDPGPLLGAEVDTLASAAVFRWTFAEHVEAELRGTLGEKPFGTILRPQLAYVTGPWRIMGGVEWIDGSDFSLPHYYRRNTSAYLIGRVAF